MDTLAEKGWSEKGNGELLDLAESEGYEVLVTTDQSMPHQQNLARWRVGVVILLSTAGPWCASAPERSPGPSRRSGRAKPLKYRS